MANDVSCLLDGIFAGKTVKRREAIYDREDEWRSLELFIRTRAWTSICGLRRTGKTTLARSVISTMKEYLEIYISMLGSSLQLRALIFSWRN